MRKAGRAVSVPAFVLVFLAVSTVSVFAQENGVRHALTLAEQTYGSGIVAMVPDGAGGVWLAGNTCSTTLPTTSNAIQKSWPGTPCGIGTGVLGRMTADGTTTYLSYFGGSGDSAIGALALGPNGNLYVAGETDSSDFPTTANAYDRTCASGACSYSQPDGFVTELTPDGSQIVFSTYLGGSDRDGINSIAVDAGGAVHAVGITLSADFPVTPGAFKTTYGGNGTNSYGDGDGFYTRLSPDGSTLQYSTYLGGSDADAASAVALDSAGNAYVTGSTLSTDFPTVNSSSQNPPNSWSGFLAKFTASGPAYSMYVGPSGGVVPSVAVVGDRVYLGGEQTNAATGGGIYVAELDAANGAAMKRIDLHGTPSTWTTVGRVVVDQNHVAYVTGGFAGNWGSPYGPESQRYPTTWDAYDRESGANSQQGVLSIVDFRPASPAVIYSTMIAGGDEEGVSPVALDGNGGAFLGGGFSGWIESVNAQPQPGSTEANADPCCQSFVVHIAAQAMTMPPPPADIVLHAYEPNPSAIEGDWKIVEDTTAAGGWSVFEPDQGAPKVTTPAAEPQNYFEAEFLAEANVPYHLWLRMKAQNNSYQNDSVWVQFSDSVDGGGNPIWRIHSADGTAVSLEDCSGCGEQGWGWNDNGYGTAATPVTFATSGWHTIRIQQREDGVAMDQIVLSSNQWANTAPGANKNDATVLAQSNEAPGDQPPAVSITKPLDGATFAPGSTITIDASASDSDGTVSEVAFYADGALIGVPSRAPYQISWPNVTAGTYTLSAVATDNQGVATSSPPVTIRVANTLPNGWTDADIGNTGAAGTAAYSNGTFTVNGAGADIWYSSDAFNYAYMLLTDNAWIVARVASVSDQAAWVKAGVMIRSSLDPSSAQAFMLVSHAKGTAFQRRTSFGGGSVSTAGAQVTTPYWVKLVRNGSTISGYESPDGITWTLVGSDTFTNLPTAVYAGLAVSSHVAGTLATATFDSVQTSVPMPWENADIGSVPIPGGAGYDTGTFTVTGSGADIWGTADAFHYVWQLMNANGSIVARVASVQQGVSSWVKAGLMMRNTFDPGSVQAMVLVSAAKGVAFQRRDVAGGTSVSTAGSASAAPHWIKLTRGGDTFTAYESPDGTNWTEIGSDTIPMAQTIYVGLAVTSHNTSSSATVTFDHVSKQ